MTNYENDTLALIHGDTPKQKYDNLKKIYAMLEIIAYPERGTVQEKLNIMDIAEMIIENKLILRP